MEYWSYKKLDKDMVECNECKKLIKIPTEATSGSVYSRSAPSTTVKIGRYFCCMFLTIDAIY